MKSEGNSKLEYGFKRAVGSESTDFMTVRTKQTSVGLVYEISIMMIVIEVSGDEIGVGYGRVPGFANAPES